MKHLRSFFAAVVLVALSGCMGLQMTPQMSAEQLKAVASDSNANATVVSYTGAGGTGTFTTLNTDKGALGTNGGSATVKPNGEISIVVNPRAETTPKAHTRSALKAALDACQPISFERNADGTCNEVHRDTECRIHFTRRVESGCATP